MKTLFKLLIICLFIGMQMPLFAKKDKKVTFQQGSYGVESSGGSTLEFKFEPGIAHNHPLMAVWLADSNGNYIETLFVAQSIGKGIFTRSKKNKGIWMPGEIQRPAALPYWAHQRNIINEYGTFNPTPQQPIPDAYTGATPQGAFILTLKTSSKISGKVQILFEINQPWDWNEHWHNNLYPNDNEYKTSCQPALVYRAIIDSQQTNNEIELMPIGHSHYSGQDGSLNNKLETISTALSISKKITVKLIEKE